MNQVDETRAPDAPLMIEDQEMSEARQAYLQGKSEGPISPRVNLPKETEKSALKWRSAGPHRARRMDSDGIIRKCFWLRWHDKQGRLNASVVPGYGVVFSKWLQLAGADDGVSQYHAPPLWLSCGGSLRPPSSNRRIQKTVRPVVWES